MKKYRLTIQEAKYFEDLKFHVRNLRNSELTRFGCLFGSVRKGDANDEERSKIVEWNIIGIIGFSRLQFFFSSMVKLSSAVGITRYYFNIWRRFSWSQDRRSKRARR